jgi:hypothetical protein
MCFLPRTVNWMAIWSSNSSLFSPLVCVYLEIL